MHNFLHPNFLLYNLQEKEGEREEMDICEKLRKKESFNLIIQSMFYSTTSSSPLMLLLFFSHAWKIMFIFHGMNFSFFLSFTRSLAPYLVRCYLLGFNSISLTVCLISLSPFASLWMAYNAREIRSERSKHPSWKIQLVNEWEVDASSCYLPFIYTIQLTSYSVLLFFFQFNKRILMLDVGTSHKVFSYSFQGLHSLYKMQCNNKIGFTSISLHAEWN